MPAFAAHDADGLGDRQRRFEQPQRDDLRYRVGHPDDEPQSRGAGPALDRVQQFASEGEDLVGVAVDHPPRVGQHEPAPFPREEPLAKSAFELTDLGGDRRGPRRNSAPAFVDAAVPHRRPEVEKMMVVEPFHGLDYSSFYTNDPVQLSHFLSGIPSFNRRAGIAAGAVAWNARRSHHEPHHETRNVAVTEPFRTYVDRRVRLVLGRFGRKVAHVTVRFTDVNGTRGGVDKLCRVEARFWGTVVVGRRRRPPGDNRSVHRMGRGRAVSGESTGLPDRVRRAARVSEGRFTSSRRILSCGSGSAVAPMDSRTVAHPRVSRARTRLRCRIDRLTEHSGRPSRPSWWRCSRSTWACSIARPTRSIQGGADVERRVGRHSPSRSTSAVWTLVRPDARPGVPRPAT